MMIYEALQDLDSPEQVVTARNNRWLKIYQQRACATRRLYCFNHVGGSAAAYKQWPQFLSDDIEVCAIQLPGREERQHESLCADIEIAIHKLTEVIIADTRPFIFFGHSFGSILAFALANRLKKIGVQPEVLIVSAKNAPHLSSKKLRSNLPRIQLLQELITMGGTPEAVLRDSVMMDRALRVVRADYAMLESFKLSQSLDCLDCPIIAFQAEEDPYTTSAGVAAWGEYTDSTFVKYVMSGGHFYINSYPQTLFSVVNSEFEKINPNV